MFKEHWFPALEQPKKEMPYTRNRKPCYEEEYCSTCPARKYCQLEGYDCFCTETPQKVKDCRKTEDGEILTCIDCKNRTKSIEAVFHGENGCD